LGFENLPTLAIQIVNIIGDKDLDFIKTISIIWSMFHLIISFYTLYQFQKLILTNDSILKQNSNKVKNAKTENELKDLLSIWEKLVKETQTRLNE